MIEVNGQQVFSQEEALENATRAEEHLDCFVQRLLSIEPDQYFDGLGISLVIKERVSFGDVLYLVKGSHLYGAQARLRSLWESLVILQYVVYCSTDLDKASEALYLHDENKRANILKTNKVWDTLAVEQQETTQALCDAYRLLPEGLRAFAERPIEQMHNKVVQAEKDALPSLEMSTVSVSQYDAMFRPFSQFVHGGIGGTHVYIRELLEEKSAQSTGREYRVAGILSAAVLWMRTLIRIWTDHSKEDRYKEIWEECGGKRTESA